MCHRAFASEEHAFSRLGLGDPIAKEEDLVHDFPGLKVPEGIFRQRGGQIVSVEVKRVIGNSLPPGSGGRRRITRFVRGKERIVWPWTSSVETALSKLDRAIAEHFRVQLHHAVFLLPRSLTTRTRRKVIDHIASTARDFLSEHSLATKVIYHIFDCDDAYFDRM